MHCLHRLILLFSVSALATIQPAVAQFEVSPDHFDDHPIAQTPPPRERNRSCESASLKNRLCSIIMPGGLRLKRKWLRTSVRMRSLPPSAVMARPCTFRHSAPKTGVPKPTGFAYATDGFFARGAGRSS
jgi:hypothetical protein